MMFPETFKLECNKNYGTKNEIWKMLSPDQYKDGCTKGWQNHHRPITIFRQKNHKLVFIEKKNIRKHHQRPYDSDSLLLTT